MIRQGREVQADITESCDVCIIGSGCGGASLAARLAERGRSVVVLEQGGYYTRVDFDQRETNMLAKVDGGRGLDTSADLSVSLTYGNNVGGASVHYWADSYRTPSDRLRLWEEKYGLKGHTEAILQPHFAQIEQDLNVHPADDSYANRMNQLIREGAEKLGWYVARVPQARKGCVSSGYCMLGCSYDAKQSQLVTYIPRMVNAGGRLYADCRAERLVFGGAKVKTLEASVLDRATGQPSGPKVRVTARVFVVAAGGFATPEFLLHQGLQERLPALGEHFFCNPSAMVHALYDEPIIQWRNIPAAWGVEEFRLARYDGPRYVEGGYLLMSNQLHPGMLSAVLPGFGASHRELMTKLSQLGGAISWIDDAEEGRVSLEKGRRRVHVPLTGGNGERLRDALRKQAKLLLTSGAREVLLGDVRDTRVKRLEDIDKAVDSVDLRPARNVFAAPHPGGGARMGADPKTSVVGFDHRVHGTDNLYVADPSVFPTAPSVDPSLSIMAFSFVAAAAIQSAL
ncbi:GMC family oxidoreductase, partial [Archangium sp.]|uniref:GMC family oxidoreductase n=1 Tax=Archangium sp. TaxID=1872627 RepID=UPI002D50CB98